MTSRPAAPESETPTCRHDVRFKDVFGLPREDNGCLACALERTALALSLAQTEIKGHMRIEDDLKARISELEKDAARVDWVERYLCRAGEVKDDAGQTVKLCRVWSIMGELETFRETVDAHIAALKDRA